MDPQIGATWSKPHGLISISFHFNQGADRVLTVSPNYSKEIQTASGGFNLQDSHFVQPELLRLKPPVSCRMMVFSSLEMNPCNYSYYS